MAPGTSSDSQGNTVAGDEGEEADVVTKDMTIDKGPVDSDNGGDGDGSICCKKIINGKAQYHWDPEDVCLDPESVAAMTEALAVELAPFNIRVNAIAPGMIETPMIDTVKSNPKTLEAMLQRMPLKRAGRSEEVSELVVFLASDSSSYITGAVVVIDGGWLAG